MIVGVDGGATKTDVAVVSINGDLLSTSRSGPANPAALPIGNVCRNLVEGIRLALSNLRDVKVRVVSISMAGYLGGKWGREIEDCLRQGLGELIKDAAVVLTEDIEAAHASAFLTGDGIVGILGTGSNFYGKYRGRRVRVGGWGHLIDDEGGAYHIGALGLSMVVKSHDGRVGDTILLKYALTHYGVSTVEELVTKIYSSEDVKGTIASFAKYVFEAARLGDEAALGIIRSEAAEVAEAITTVARRLGTYELPIALIGGTYMANRDIWRRFLEPALSQRLGRPVTVGEAVVLQSCAASLIPLSMGIITAPGTFINRVRASCSLETHAAGW